MGLGSTAKKVQRIADIAENVYSRMNDLVDRVIAMEESVEETNDRVRALEREVRAQRTLLEAVADAEGVEIPEAAAEVPTGEDASGDGTPDADGAGDAATNADTDGADASANPDAPAGSADG